MVHQQVRVVRVVRVVQARLALDVRVQHWKEERVDNVRDLACRALCDLGVHSSTCSSAFALLLMHCVVGHVRVALGVLTSVAFSML
jgi:hypothetical protein